MDYKIIRKKVKNIRIRVTEVGEVVVSCPLFVKDEKIKELIETNKKWIEDKLKLVKESKKEIDFIWYLGNKFKIEYWNKKEYYLDKEKGIFYVHKEYVKEGLHQFYTSEGKMTLTVITKNCCDRVNTEINSLSLKWMKTRWGSCNPKKRYINLNYELMKYPVECITYVVYHELAHIYEGNHSKNFWSKVSEFEPRYKELREVFKKPL
ncbi:MAG: M48 family metallopeptidase [Clostridium sp.]